jgi:hypothetical protein
VARFSRNCCFPINIHLIKTNELQSTFDHFSHSPLIFQFSDWHDDGYRWLNDGSHLVPRSKCHSPRFRIHRFYASDKISRKEKRFQKMVCESIKNEFVVLHYLGKCEFAATPPHGGTNHGINSPSRMVLEKMREDPW